MCYYFRKGLRRALIGTEYDTNMLAFADAQRRRREELRAASDGSQQKTKQPVRRKRAA